MKAVVQRVTEASVEVEGEALAQIGQGFLVLLGVEKGDKEETAERMASKISRLRIMNDEDQHMNLDLDQSGGEVLSVPQFTLCADTSKGNRPSFIKAADPEEAEMLYNLFVQRLEKTGLKVETGRFGAYMQVSLINDGPVTIILEE